MPPLTACPPKLEEDYLCQAQDVVGDIADANNAVQESWTLSSMLDKKPTWLQVYSNLPTNSTLAQLEQL